VYPPFQLFKQFTGFREAWYKVMVLEAAPAPQVLISSNIVDMRTCEVGAALMNLK
jgi:hypothetical protein